MRVITLYRSLTGQELALLEASGWRAFPPSLSGQPAFYSTPDEAYARKIASDCKAPHNYDGLGFVARFGMRADFVQAYVSTAIGASGHEAYSIPAADLPAFNAAIDGRIDIIAAYGIGGERSDLLATIEQ
jgi:hypothetical protein